MATEDLLLLHYNTRTTHAEKRTQPDIPAHGTKGVTQQVVLCKVYQKRFKESSLRKVQLPIINEILQNNNSALATII